MTAQVSAPVSTSVIACDIAGAESFEAKVLAGFDKVLEVARGLGFVTQESGKPNLSLTLAPELAVGDVLGHFASATGEFDAAAQPLQLRSMVHYGVVFRTESAGAVSYVGSAIRSTQSALRRAPPMGGFMATHEFSAYAAKLLNLPFRLLPLQGGVATEGMSRIVFGGNSVAPPRASGEAQVSADQAFADFVKRRLAEDVGPFASALVDRALRSSTAADQLIPALGRQIDDPVARARFEDDVRRHLKAHAGA